MGRTRRASNSPLKFTCCSTGTRRARHARATGDHGGARSTRLRAGRYRWGLNRASPSRPVASSGSVVERFDSLDEIMRAWRFPNVAGNRRGRPQRTPNQTARRCVEGAGGGASRREASLRLRSSYIKCSRRAASSRTSTARAGPNANNHGTASLVAAPFSPRAAEDPACVPSPCATGVRADAKISSLPRENIHRGRRRRRIECGVLVQRGVRAAWRVIGRLNAALATFRGEDRRIRVGFGGRAARPRAAVHRDERPRRRARGGQASQSKLRSPGVGAHRPHRRGPLQDAVVVASAWVSRPPPRPVLIPFTHNVGSRRTHVTAEPAEPHGRAGEGRGPPPRVCQQVFDVVVGGPGVRQDDHGRVQHAEDGVEAADRPFFEF